MTYTTVAEQRQQRAEVIAQGASSWLLVTTRSGEHRMAIPSQSHAGKYHLASLDRCSCRDASYRSGACKHRLAVKLALTQCGLI